MSFTITQIPSGERDAWSSLVFSDYQEELFQKQTELLAAAEDEVPQSALLARVSEGRYEILALYGGGLPHARRCLRAARRSLSARA